MKQLDWIGGSIFFVVGDNHEFQWLRERFGAMCIHIPYFSWGAFRRYPKSFPTKNDSYRFGESLYDRCEIPLKPLGPLKIRRI